ncbi:MAG TPA: trigger factor [Acidobacteriaceae bacterium]|nr:trigger factor [Acidobacteriaceae bacterium]
MSSTETIENTPHTHGPADGEEHAAHAEGEAHSHHHESPALNPELTREVEIEVSADEVSRKFKAVTRRYQKAARIPGFRLGKVPESLIRGRFAEQIRQEVMEAVLPEHFRGAIAERKLQPISQPQVTNLEFEEGKPLRFKAAFEVLPEISIEGYQEVKVEKPDVSLSEAEFEEELARIRDSRSTMEPVTEERGLVDGDFAEISFTGHVQGSEEAAAQTAGETPGAESEPIVAHDVLIEIGGKNTLESFNGALRGATAGQELKFEVSYPEDFGERKLAGKTVSYDVQVKSIKKKIEPELNDEFAKELGPYESYAAFAEQLRDHLAREKRRRLENETKSRLVDALVAKYDFPVPESLVQQQVDTRLDRGLRALAAQGMRTQDMRNIDFDRLRTAQRGPAAAEVKGSLLLDRIADAEQIQVPEAEVDRELQTISRDTEEPLDALRKRLTDNGGLARIREQLRREKTGALLYERLSA